MTLSAPARAQNRQIPSVVSICLCFTGNPQAKQSKQAVMSSPKPPPLTPEQEATIGEDKGPSVMAVSGLFIGLCTVAVALRFYARFNRRVALGLDDWMSAASLVSLACRRQLSMY